MSLKDFLDTFPEKGFIFNEQYGTHVNSSILTILTHQIALCKSFAKHRTVFNDVNTSSMRITGMHSIQPIRSFILIHH
jgi:hypothetical protein